MRTNIILSAALFISFFFFASQANAQMIVSDSTKAPGIKLVQSEDGDPVLIVYNLGQMTLDQLETSSKTIEEDIESTQDEIYTLSKCDKCQDGIPSLRERVVKNEKILVQVDLQIQKRMDEKPESEIVKNK